MKTILTVLIALTSLTTFATDLDPAQFDCVKKVIRTKCNLEKEFVQTHRNDIDAKEYRYTYTCSKKYAVRNLDGETLVINIKEEQSESYHYPVALNPMFFVTIPIAIFERGRGSFVIRSFMSDVKNDFDNKVDEFELSLPGKCE